MHPVRVLLDANDRDIIELVTATRLQQVEVNLAAAEHDAPHLRGIELVDLVDDRRGTALAEFGERRDRQLVAQQALRGHHDERLA